MMKLTEAMKTTLIHLAHDYSDGRPFGIGRFRRTTFEALQSRGLIEWKRDANSGNYYVTPLGYSTSMMICRRIG